MIPKTFALALFITTSIHAKPNIIFILIDDMGWTGSSVEMIQDRPETKSDFYQTPNLEKLAANGMVFSQAYAPGSMCTPSRASILTGQSPAKLHITTPGAGKTDPTKKVLTPKPSTRLPDQIQTIGTTLKAEGYATALLGKWHIGRNDHAGTYGFDLHDGHTENESDGTSSDPKEIFSLTERGIEFMEKNVKTATPFYLQISHYAVHTPTQSQPESIAQFEQAPSGKIHKESNYAGMTWDFDTSLGLIFNALEKLDITKNTYIVFMSDNGAGGNRRKPNNTPLFAGKGTLYEGGIRVPFIISGPMVNQGQYCSTPVTGTDLLATLSCWAGAPAEHAESEDLSPLLCGNDLKFTRKSELLFHSPHYGRGPLQKPQTALISGNWKLLKDWETDSLQLFNLENDLGEHMDLSSVEPAKLSQLTERLNKRLKETNAQRPENNPNY